MGDLMDYNSLREEDKESNCRKRLDVWFLSNKLFKPTKRVTFRMCTLTEIKELLNKAKAIVEQFRLYDDFQFVILDEEQG